MKLSRPYIPIRTRIKVAKRQLEEFGLVNGERFAGEEDRVYLDRMLCVLAACLDPNDLFQPMQLDHDPALCNRKYFPRSKRYEPDANNPRFLVYRLKDGHDVKTRIRGDGAQLSDLALRRKFKRIEKRTREGKR